MSAAVRIALLGTGTVGSAVLARLEHLQACGPDRDVPALQLVAVANTRSLQLLPGAHQACVAGGGNGHADAAVHALGARGARVVVDAAASEAVAGQHAAWLAAGLHVVTACKLGRGTSLSRWQAIRAAARASGCHYGDSATVGAGLPVLRTIRALQRGGDRIHGVAGVLSGSLAWLLSRHDGSRPFDELVEQARVLGYTEPDPRIDLGGEDVRRKLLIIARTAGMALEPDAVQVAPVQAGTLQRLHAIASAEGRVLRHVGRLQRDGNDIRATVGIEVLDRDDPLAGAGSDNRIAVRSDRYRERPLLIQGPGAGAEVTAAALLDDVFEIARVARSYEPVAAASGLRTSASRYSSSGLGWSMA